MYSVGTVQIQLTSSKTFMHKRFLLEEYTLLDKITIACSHVVHVDSVVVIVYSSFWKLFGVSFWNILSFNEFNLPQPAMKFSPCGVKNKNALTLLGLIQLIDEFVSFNVLFDS